MPSLNFLHPPVWRPRPGARFPGVAIVVAACLAAATPPSPAFAARARAPSQDADVGVCARHMAVPPDCRWVDAVVALAGAPPAFRLQVRGIRRPSAIGPAEREWMPDNLRAALGVDNAVAGHLRICPISRATGGLPRTVCVDQARSLRVVDVLRRTR